MKPASFSKYLKGRRRPGAVVLKKLSQLGVNINWLLSGTGAMLDEARTMPLDRPPSPGKDRDETGAAPDAGHPLSRFHRVPLVQIHKDAERTFRLVDIGTTEWVSDTFTRREHGVRPELIRDFRISGDSMIDTIRPGDRVRGVLWKDHSLSDSSICILQGPMSSLVRRVRVRDRTIILVADNPDVPDLELEPEQWNDDYNPIAHILEISRAA